MQGSPLPHQYGNLLQQPGEGMDAAILYNRIGKRIIGVGNRYGSSSEGDARNIPNSTKCHATASTSR
jgi:hypothetical protein